MNFEHDIFISYAHLDNCPLVEGSAGWITQLDRALKTRVGQLLGREVLIWRDPKLQGNDYFADTLIERLALVRAMVAVVSPRYLESEWCRREYQEFQQAAASSGGVRIGDKSRVFKLVKTPVPLDQQLPEMQKLLGYDFFVTDPDTGRQRELIQAFGPEMQQQYWLKVDDLAHHLCDVINQVDAVDPDTGTEQAANAVGGKGMVYLAETTSDLKEQRSEIERDLNRHGYGVLPDQPPPLTVASEFEAFVRQQMAQAKLSVHLIGSRYGVVPEGTDASIVAVQNDIACEQEEAGLPRLIWLAPDMVPDDEKQREFIHHLTDDSRLSARMDLLETPLEELKSSIYEMLNPPESARSAAEPVEETGDEPTRIYLLCCEQDLEAIDTLTEFLFDQGFEVVTPLFGADETEFRLDHEANLRECDAFLVFYGACNEMWQRRKMSELRKSAGQGRTKATLARAILVAPPSTPQKARLRTHEALVVRPQDGVAVADLEPFVAKIRGNCGASR